MTARLVLLVAGLLAFALLHSLLAAARVRARLVPLVGPAYRFAYNVFAAASLLALFVLSRGEWPVVWEAQGAMRFVLRGLQLAAGMLMLATAASMDLAHFAGLRQLRGAPERSSGFHSGGVYHLCRHPLYLAACVFFSAWPRWTCVG